MFLGEPRNRPVTQILAAAPPSSTAVGRAQNPKIVLLFQIRSFRPCGYGSGTRFPKIKNNKPRSNPPPLGLKISKYPPFNFSLQRQPSTQPPFKLSLLSHHENNLESSSESPKMKTPFETCLFFCFFLFMPLGIVIFFCFCFVDRPNPLFGSSRGF